VQIRSVTVDSRSFFCDKTLEEIAKSFDFSFLVAVVLRQQHYIIPSGNTTIQEGDVLYVVATEEDFERLFSRLGKPRRELRRVVVVGGGRIGSQITAYLLQEPNKSDPPIRRLFRSFGNQPARNVKLVERDYGKCKMLTERFPNALVINADISDEGVFEEEYFADSDLVVAATDNQEMNIVTAIYAKSFGIKRSIVLVNKASYIKVASNLGIDVPVSLKHSTVNSILKFLRRGNVRSVHSISDGRVEIVEISVEEGTEAIGKELQDIKMPPNSLIVSVIRQKEHMIPGGTFVVEPGDRVIIIANKEHIDRVQALFTSGS
jgi:trk system potassium uptake protein TrkA